MTVVQGKAWPRTIYQALLAFQAEAPSLQKDKINPAFRSKYLSLDALMVQVMPTLNKHGLVWTTLPTGDEHGPALIYRLVHAESGDQIEGMMPLLLDKENPQGLGSSLTYAKRYAMLAVLGLVADEDDDGQKASMTVKRQPPPAVVVAAHDVKELKAAAKGLTVAQIKAAFEVIGLEPPSPFPKELAAVFANVPQANAAALAAALQADVPWEGGNK